jgi:phosphoribosyl 1,2-cyclic phosphate phosphodiesterase
MRVTILGSGSSNGTPIIGCTCMVCTSNHPKNKRLRASLLLEINGINILIDSSPDLRQQALANRITKIDAVLYTHAHADHVHGIDELRVLSKESIPIYSDAKTIEELQQRFPYVFLPKPTTTDWYRPSLLPNILTDTLPQRFDVLGSPFTAFEQGHGYTTTLGYRIGDIVYSTDAKTLPEESFDALQGVRIWIVDCLRRGESPGHSTLENTLQWIARVKPQLAVLTHLSHDFDHETLAKELPPGVIPAYDGMVLE